MMAAHRRLRAIAVPLWLAVSAALPSTLTTLAALLGWAALTAGIAIALSLLHPALGWAVWGLSTGALLLVVPLGWKLLRVIVREGLYSLHRESQK